MDDEEEEVSYEEVVKQGLQDDEFDDFLVDKTIWDELKSRHFDKTELAAEYLARRFVNIGKFLLGFHHPIVLSNYFFPRFN